MTSPPGVMVVTLGSSVGSGVGSGVGVVGLRVVGSGVVGRVVGSGVVGRVVGSGVVGRVVGSGVVGRVVGSGVVGRVVGSGVVGRVVGSGVVGRVVGSGVVGRVVGSGVVGGAVVGFLGGSRPSYGHSITFFFSPLRYLWTVLSSGYFPAPQFSLKSSNSRDQAIAPPRSIFFRYEVYCGLNYHYY